MEPGAPCGMKSCDNMSHMIQVRVRERERDRDNVFQSHVVLESVRSRIKNASAEYFKGLCDQRRRQPISCGIAQHYGTKN